MAIPPSAPSSPPDEDTLVLPDAWRRDLHPRRGGAAGPGIEIDAGAVTAAGALVQQVRGTVEMVLARWPGDAGPAARVREHVDGLDADGVLSRRPDPFGAAVVAAVAGGMPRARRDFGEVFVDAWTALHGVAFAACTFAELTQMSFGDGEFSFVPSGEYAALPEEAPRRLRALLAASGADDYRDAVAGLAACRRTPFQRLVTGYLVPTERGWVDEVCADPPPAEVGPAVHWAMFCALSTADQVRALGGLPIPCTGSRLFGIMTTMADGLGGAVAPLLAALLDGGAQFIARRRAVEVLAALPSDEACAVLACRVDRRDARLGMLAVMERSPARALRALAEAAGTAEASPHAAELLNDQVRADPGMAAAELPGLTAGARALVEPLVATWRRAEEASAETLPRVLTEPPWTRRRQKTGQPVLKGLTAPAEQSVVWGPAERDAWLQTVVAYPNDWWEGWSGYASLEPVPAADRPAWEKRIADFRARRLTRQKQTAVLLGGPEESVRPLLAGWFLEGWVRTAGPSDSEQWMPPVLARFELDALPIAISFARSGPIRFGALLVPFLNAEVAALMADWASRLRGGKEITDAWFARHGVTVVPHLVPAALGTAVKRRRDAERALHALASAHGGDAVVEAARAHGAEAADGVAAILARDPRDLVPRKIPNTGWADPARLPQVLLRDRADRLPDTVVAHLVTALALSAEDGEPHEGVRAAREICDPASLADLGWELFQLGPGWTLTTLGWTGDDAVARRLTPLIRAWSGDGRHQRAVRGLDALANMGTEVALNQLNGIAQTSRYKGVKARAQDRMADVAAALGLTAEQLADRVVPDLGLDEAGATTLDYGTRRFVIGFDERLEPCVADEDGTPRKSLPKPGARDDAGPARAAYARFAELKKEARAIAGLQIRRMEAAMVARRRWTPEEFGALFVRHPLMRHLARRLVWLADDGGEIVPFRLAEDRTLASAGDDVLVLPAAARVGIAHPLHLGDALAAWSEVFADYEILQPFPQLDRPVHTLTAEERAGTRLRRFEGRTASVGKILGLTRRGWERGGAEDGGLEFRIFRPLPDGRAAVIGLDPGIPVVATDYAEKQELEAVWLKDGPQSLHHAPELPFGELDPVIASEIIADLEEVVRA
ncbi:DUF4132 domain-containing protein [Spirillospora sp. NBC_01491]|uniref:DUF4132 domain-containing protein n=1 Tax=Spirillospora sp. NBC_01491 TaxID=2976007 RepID=UPI002E345454|nr:DUF4132 domain-containing protein [Spirillospora sp. NBC_01491]